MQWRSKQNLDYAFLMMYAQWRGTFYVQLEDDILTKPYFIATMRDFALEKTAAHEPCSNGGSKRTSARWRSAEKAVKCCGAREERNDWLDNLEPAKFQAGPSSHYNSQLARNCQLWMMSRLFA